MATQFAVKDCMDLVITEKSGSKSITIDYLNSCQLQIDSETVYAKKKGDNAISFSASRTGTFTMEAEVIDEQYLAWILGAKLQENGDMIVGKELPSESYTIAGHFAIRTAEGEEVRYIKMYNCKPQIATDLTLSATDVANFSLVFDVMVDADANMLKLSKNEIED